jgi:hypothetical protein
LTLHSIFLRNACILPSHLGVLIEPSCEGWRHVEQIESHAFDVMVRRAQWHFMWVQDAHSRRGFGTTEETAIQRALERALKSVSMRFNAAEFDSLQISRFPGFYIANVTMQARHIQQNTSLEMAAESYLQGTR